MPPAFQSSRILRRLTTASVVLSLAVSASAILVHLTRDLVLAATGSLPTLLVGFLWAVGRQAPTRSMEFGKGDLYLLPLLFFFHGLWLPSAGLSWTIGAIFLVAGGILVSLPILTLVVCVFGPPISWAAKQAKQGLVGQEKGEIAVGLASAGLAFLGLIGALHGLVMLPTPPPPLPIPPLSPYELAGLAWTALLGAVGLLAGGTAAGLAAWRGRNRRRFVAAAAAGKQPGYRVDATTEGRVLVRVASVEPAYRGADEEEEVFALDEEELTRAPLRAAGE